MSSPDTRPTITRQDFHDLKWDELIQSYDDYMAMTLEERSKILDAQWVKFKELSDAGFICPKQ